MAVARQPSATPGCRRGRLLQGAVGEPQPARRALREIAGEDPTSTWTAAKNAALDPLTPRGPAPELMAFLGRDVRAG